MANAGDVFTRRLPDGRYAAVRVLRTRGSSSLVATTPYLDRKRPSLREPLLRRVVIQRRFHYNGEAARSWLDGQPPQCFAFLGNIPLSKAEARTRCDTYGDRWTKSDGDQALLEWRWLRDRRAFERETRHEEEEEEAALQRRHRSPRKPKRMMSEDEFWSIIALLDRRHRRKKAAVLAHAIEALAAKSKAEIRRFEERLAHVLYQLDTEAHAGSASDDPRDPNYLSADSFLYARCAVIAGGRRLYEDVLKHPRKMPKDAEFEALLSLASDAYELKTGEEFRYVTGCSYESFSNSAGWGRQHRGRNRRASL